MGRRQPTLSTQLFRSSSTIGPAAKAAQFIQDRKVRISRDTIRSLQQQGRWPEEYNSFVISERKKNRYKEPERFFRQMEKNPQFYARKFIFRPVIDVSGVLKEATQYAASIVARQAALFTVRSGLYISSFKIRVDGVEATNSSLDNLTEDSIVNIYSNAPYAGALEARSTYNPKMGGVLYFAAQKVKQKYPTIGVGFSYRRAEFVEDAYTYWMVPIITLGSRKNVVDTMRKPGNRIRRRARAAKKAERLRNKVNR